MLESAVKPYVRPSLCRLCEGPVADRGVWMAELDLEKLRRWWLWVFETELNEDLDTLDDLCASYICQFCLWDARYRSKGDRLMTEQCDWWTVYDFDQCYEDYYYEAWMIRPCAVKISPLKLQGSKSSVENVKVEPVQKQLFPHLKPTYCVYCRALFKNRRDAFRHVATTHKNIQTFECRTCEIHFNCSRERADHFRNYHPRVACPKCLKKYQERYLQRHVAMCHTKNETPETLARCIYCKVEVHFTGLVRHIKRFHSAVKIRCIYPECRTYFKTQKELKKHVKVVHESQAGLVQCLYCPLKFQKRMLNNHSFKVHTAQAIRCTAKACLTFFHTEEERDRHIANIHQVEKTDFFCIYCGQLFWKKSTLIGHINWHHKSERIKCKIRGCTEYFKTETDQNNHAVENHSEEISKMVFNCEECDFSSKSLWSMRNHVVHKHSSEKHPCQQCPRVFTSEKCLYRHKVKVHNLLHLCVHCNNHIKLIKSHVKVKPCKKCGERMPCKNIMAVHSKRCIP